jgi:hypothetical protein
VVLFYLVVRKLENLKTVRQRRLDRLRLTEVVNYLLVWVCLLDISVDEVNYLVAVGVSLSADLVCEYDLLLTVLVHPLDLAISSNILVDDG